MKTPKTILPVIVVALLINLAFKQEIKRVTSSDEEKERLAKTIVQNLSAAKYEDVRSDFHETLKQILSVEKIANAWENLISSVGNFESISSIQSSKMQAYEIVRVKCKFKSGNCNVDVTFNDENKVVGLYLNP